MASKSVNIPPVIIVTFSYTVISILTNNVFATNSTQSNYKYLEILADLPLKTELDGYLTKLLKIVHFSNKYKLYVDLNFAFGLFLVNVNLRKIMEIKGSLPTDLDTRLHQVLKMNDKTMEFYRNMSQTNKVNYNTKELDINKLFVGSEVSWTNRMQNLGTDLLRQTKVYTKRELIKKYSKWSLYKLNIYDFEHYNPTPETSDFCMSALAKNNINTKTGWIQCQIPQRCRVIITNGSDVGYAMTHRLLFLLIARFSRGCTITLQDKRHLDKICARIYNEAEYLAHHDFQLPDLFLEQIGLCSLEGHAQFLRQSWLEELMKYQTELGCVGAKDIGDGEIIAPDLKYKTERSEWKLMHKDQDIFGKMCNTHTTGIAAAAIAAVIRYIIETFY